MKSDGAGTSQRSRKARFSILAVVALLALIGAAAMGLGLLGAADSDAASSGKGSMRVSILEHYKLTKPDFKDKLPGRLKEVSGVTPISDDEVACVQDEDGVVYVYDFRTRSVTRKVRFGPDGDYEEISSVGDTLYVLRSDGVLFELRDWREGEEPDVRTHELGMQSSDSEGLAFDPENNRLLIAPKVFAGLTKATKSHRKIFAFSLETRHLLPEPVISFDVNDVIAFARERGKRVPMVERKNRPGKKPALRFLPSGVAVHPITKDIVVLSSVDRVIASFDPNGTPTGYEQLGEKLFRQPEGVAFLPNGDMIVTNEGRGKKATLLRFRLRKKQKLTRALGEEIER